MSITDTFLSMDRNALDLLLKQMDTVLDAPDEVVFSGELDKALVIRLDSESTELFSIPDNWLRSYESGPALAARLWCHFAGSEADSRTSYEADNPVVVTSGALSESNIPMSGSCTIAFRSPQTKALYYNVGSMTFGKNLARCGYRALVICGRLRRTGHVELSSSEVNVRIYEGLCNLTVSQAVKMLGNDGLFTGPAGEQHVIYASAVCDGNTTGRGGLGYVLGMKNLKAVTIVTEDKEVEVRERQSALSDLISNSRFVEGLRKSGSSLLLKTAASKGIVPVDNFRYRTDPRLFYLTSDEADRRWGKDSITQSNLKFMFSRETPDGKKVPGFEANVMLGSNLGCFDPESVLHRYNLSLDMGLDYVSLGNILGWCKQAQENGIKVLDKDVDFTDNNDVLPIIEGIGTGQLKYSLLAAGVDELGKAYSAQKYAYSINGLECGPYDYRGSFCEALNQGLGNWFPVYFGFNFDLASRDFPFWVSLNEELVLGLESLGISPSLLIPFIMDIKGFKLKLISSSKRIASKYFMLNEISDELAAYSGQVVDKAYIARHGRRARRLVREINAFLSGGNRRVYVPDHFCVDPESNSTVSSIVPMHSLVEAYNKIFNYICALQDSGVK